MQIAVLGLPGKAGLLTQGRAGVNPKSRSPSHLVRRAAVLHDVKWTGSGVAGDLGRAVAEPLLELDDDKGQD